MSATLRRQAESLIAMYGTAAFKDTQRRGPSTQLSGPQQQVQVERCLEIATKRLQKPGLLVLNDPVGTGKTVVALAAASLLLEQVAPSQRVNRVLIVAPNAVVADNWRQRARWIGLDPDTRGARLTVVTQHDLSDGPRLGLPRDRSRLLLIVDEAHRGLHRDGQTYARIRPLALNARVMLVTATPFQLSADGLERMIEIDGDDARGNRIREYGRAVAEWLRIRHDHETGLAEAAAVKEAAAARDQALRAASADLKRVLMPPYPFERMKRDPDVASIPRDPELQGLGPWATAYHAARIVPELISDDEGDTATPHNSDTYMRMLVSSRGAWMDSAVFRAASAQGGPVAKLLATIDDAMGGRALGHPKVASTAQLAVEEIRGGNHVLVFCVFNQTQKDLSEAITELAARQGLHPRVEAPDGINAARRVLEDGFARPPRAGDSPIVMIVRDNLSESVDLDGGQPVVIHHDLSWSPVRWEQRMGRVVRASTGFKKPKGTAVVVLDTSVDQRMWKTLHGRRALTQHVTDPDLARLLLETLPDRDDADDV